MLVARVYGPTAREYHKERAKCNFDEQGERTNWRVRVSNTSDAQKKYVMVAS